VIGKLWLEWPQSVAQPGAIFPSRNFRNIAQQFLHLQELSKNKDEILYAIHENFVFQFRKFSEM